MQIQRLYAYVANECNVYSGVLLSLIYSYLAFYIFLFSFWRFSMTTLWQLCVYDSLRLYFIILLSSLV